MKFDLDIIEFYSRNILFFKIELLQINLFLNGYLIFDIIFMIRLYFVVLIT